MNATEISAIILVCIFGGAMLGTCLRGFLPESHLDAETKDLIKLGAGLIGTMAALLLGLLVASAKSSYDDRRTELTQMASNTIVLDRVLAHYGPEAGAARSTLKVVVARLIAQIWPQNGTAVGVRDSQSLRGRELILDQIQGLSPRTDAQRALQSQAETMAISIGQTRWLLFEQSGSSISTPLSCRRSLLAQHALCEFRIIRAAECNCRSYPVGERRLSCRCDVFNPGAGSPLFGINPDFGRSLA